MSGEIDYRTHCGRPSEKSKYLSDSLTPWYGAWVVVTPTIDYANLPAGDVLARLYKVSAGAVTTFNLQFNAPQNLSNHVVDIWTRASINNAQLRLFVSGDGGFTLPSGVLSIYAVGGTINWRKDTISMSRSTLYVGPSVSLALARVGYLQFYFNGLGAGETYEIAGLNFRRL